MKELLNGLWVLFCALIVSCLMFSVGTLYTLLYGIWFSRRAKKGNRLTALFRFLWRILDGMAAAVGYALYEMAYSLDLAWNVNGEIVEDMVTTKEDTEFTKKNVSISESIGKLEIDGDLNKFGKKFTKMLNVFFNQKQHAIDAWRFNQAKKKLMEDYFEERK
jgi:hypothetical protein